MEVSYKKDGNNTFMIIKDVEIDENDYKYQMVSNNIIDGLIPMSVKSVDNRQEIYYNTASLLSLESTYAKKQISGEEIYNLIKSIKTLSDKMREYLVNINSVLFGMEYIYKQRFEEKYSFCYCPGREGDFHEDVRRFFEQMPEYVDHEDEKAVLIAYGLQQVIDNDDFTVQDLWDCVELNMKNREPEYPEFLERQSMAEEIGATGYVADGYVNRIGVNENRDRTRANTGKKGAKKEEKQKNKSKKKIFGFVKNKKGYVGEEELYGATFLKEEKTETTLTLRCCSENGAPTITIEKFPCIIGKSRRNSDYTLDNPVVSRTHIRIMKNPQSYFAEDLNSSNGTYINGELLTPYELKEIKQGDKIMLANVEFVVE